jgi:TetR/AcrR family transcriptional regulator
MLKLVFSGNIDISKAVEIILWTIEGFSNKAVPKIKNSGNFDSDYESILTDMEPYIIMLKKCFYKE